MLYIFEACYKIAFTCESACSTTWPRPVRSRRTLMVEERKEREGWA